MKKKENHPVQNQLQALEFSENKFGLGPDFRPEHDNLYLIIGGLTSHFRAQKVLKGHRRSWKFM